MNKIREACQTVSPGYKPAISFVVVQKRHHTRLFPTNPRDEVCIIINVQYNRSKKIKDFKFLLRIHLL